VPLFQPAAPRAPTPVLADAAASAISSDLVTQGWSQRSSFLPRALTVTLADECRQHAAAGRMHLAGVGQRAASAPGPGVRGDRIAWLEHGQSAACDRYLEIMETLRLALNRDLYLGLETYESHFACYAAGAGYQKHVDRFRHDDRRTVSVVIYLNHHWRAGQGGALRLYPADTPVIDVAPVGSRMVLFLSADLPHEVMPATRQRLSLAGWFRRR